MMKKTVVVLASMFALLLSGCLPFFTPAAGTGPTVDATGTADALFKTAVAQTLTAQPTLPPPSVSDTPTGPVVADSPTFPPASDTPFPTFTLPPDLTTPATATIESPIAASGLTSAAATGTATLAPGQPVPTWTLGVRTYGTLPPAVPFSKITLVNKAKAEAYLSLHVDLANGSNTVIEYPVEGTRTIKAPTGPYRYVAWVGGRKMIGAFKLTQNDDLTITLYKDKVVVK
jgi:hypothetical protein